MSEALDRSLPPPPGALRPFRFPAFERARLANGLQVLTARLARFPLVSLELLAPAGAGYDALDLPGLATLHGELLDESTAQRSALAIAETVEALGGRLSSGAGWNIASVDAALLARHLAPGLGLLSEVVRSPRFAADDLERLRQERLAEILRRQVHPSSLADRCFAAVVYRGTVYGQPLLGTAQSVAAIDREAVAEFYRRHVVPQGSTLIAVGDLDPEALLASAERGFGDWPAAAPPPRPEIAPTPLAATEVHIVDRPGSAQVQLQLGHAGVPRSHPDFLTLLVLNSIFGGKFISRINLNLRERHAFTYGASSSFSRRLGPGPFIIRAAVATPVAGAAVRELLAELRQIRDEEVSEDELRETRDYLIGVFPYTLQTVDDLTRRLESLATFDLPDDFYDGYTEHLAQISRADLLAVARRHLHPDRLAIVAVGPAVELRPQLAPFGPVYVHPASSETFAEAVAG